MFIFYAMSNFSMLMKFKENSYGWEKKYLPLLRLYNFCSEMIMDTMFYFWAFVPYRDCMLEVIDIILKCKI